MSERIVVDFDQHGTDYRDHYPEISHELRGKCPVTWSENYGGYWVVTGLQEAGEIFRHPTTSTTLGAAGWCGS